MKKILLAVSILALSFSLFGCGGTTEDEDTVSNTSPSKNTSTENNATTDSTLAVPFSKFTVTNEVLENGRLYIDYKIYTSSQMYFGNSDQETRSLAEEAFDEGLKLKESNYPDIGYILISVSTSNGDMAFVIEQPSTIAAPKIVFYKYQDGVGSVYDYEWYDSRYGNGQTW